MSWHRNSGSLKIRRFSKWMLLGGPLCPEQVHPGKQQRPLGLSGSITDQIPRRKELVWLFSCLFCIGSRANHYFRSINPHFNSYQGPLPPSPWSVGGTQVPCHGCQCEGRGCSELEWFPVTYGLSPTIQAHMVPRLCHSRVSDCTTGLSLHLC